MHPFIYSFIATVIISSVSFVGIILLLKKSFAESPFVTGLISFAAGGLLGDAFLHLIPDHIKNFGYNQETPMLIFVGIILMLIVEAYFHCHHDDSGHEHNEKEERRILAKLNILGTILHNFLDGTAVAASFLISTATGFTSTFAIIMHEIPQEFAHTVVLSYSGMKRKKILLVNFLTALTACLGVVFVFVIQSIDKNASKFLVPIAAGQFIYIALADLLPEIHKKSGVKKYIVEIGMFILGLGIMLALTYFD